MIHRKLKILYIHHYGKFGGASKSLFELVNCLKTQIEGHIVSQNGLVPIRFAEIGFSTITSRGISIFDHTVFGYYRGLRWLVLLREFFYLPFTFMAIRKARKWDIDVIHVNDVSLLPAIFFCRLFFSKPIIIHARIVLLKKGLRYKLYGRFLKKFGTYLIAIDKSVYNSIPAGIPSTIIHNGLKVPTSEKVFYNEITPLKVAMIGGLIHMKGLLEFIQSAKILKEKGVNVKYLIIGESPTNFDSFTGRVSKKIGLVKDINDEINDFILKNNLSETIEVRPFTLDVNAVYAEIDVLCFANYANAAGRPVFEAAFHRKPSICSEPKEIADGIIHNSTGLSIDSKNPQQLADAIEYFSVNRAEVKRMGENAYHHACQNFDIEKNAEQVMTLYNKIYKLSLEGKN